MRRVDALLAQEALIHKQAVEKDIRSSSASLLLRQVLSCQHYLSKGPTPELKRRRESKAIKKTQQLEKTNALYRSSSTPTIGTSQCATNISNRLCSSLRNAS
jgi:hypothetical protein